MAIITLPLGILFAFTIMRLQGVNANIMSLGGIAIAIGAMVDAAVVMIENAHKHLERWTRDHPGEVLAGPERWREITAAAVEVGPALFLSLLIITFSFVPIFSLQGQEGRLFAPLAFTKTYAMAGAAILSITLIPVLMGLLIKGRIPSEESNPINRWLTQAYRPAIDWVIAKPKTVLLIAGLVFATSLWPISQMGGEFMPQMSEGDLLYMPSALPGISTAEASRLLQLTDRMIKTVPEVESVFGKAGRADTATDPAPLEMFETTIQLKPRDQWRPGMTVEKLIEELDQREAEHLAIELDRALDVATDQRQVVDAAGAGGRPLLLGLEIGGLERLALCLVVDLGSGHRPSRPQILKNSRRILYASARSPMTAPPGKRW